MEIEIIPLTKKAAQGDAEARLALFAMFKQNEILPIVQEQIHIYVKQAAKHAAEAIYLRALLFEKGFGVEVDVDMAFLLMREAASKGYAIAIYDVGRHFLQGIGVDQSDESAARWLKLAASSPYYVPEAMFELGMLYEQGKGVSANENIAKGWFESAATAGHALAKEKIAAKKND